MSLFNILNSIRIASRPETGCFPCQWYKSTKFVNMSNLTDDNSNITSSSTIVDSSYNANTNGYFPTIVVYFYITVAIVVCVLFRRYMDQHPTGQPQETTSETISDEKVIKANFDLRYARIEASLVNKYVEKHDRHCDNIILCQNMMSPNSENSESFVDVELVDPNIKETDNVYSVVNPKIEVIEDDHVTYMSDNSMFSFDCSICLEPFAVNDIISWTSCCSTCNHVFHHSCIKAWLLKHDTCPDCRQEIVTHQKDLNRLKTGDETKSYYCHHHGVIHVQPSFLSELQHSSILERCRRIPTVEEISSTRRYPTKKEKKRDDRISIRVVMNGNNHQEPTSPTVQ